MLALVAVICSLVLLANWYCNRLVPGLLSCAAGFVMLAAGLILLSTQNTLPPFISVLLANSLLMAGRILILIGLATFWNQEKSLLPLFCVILCVAAVAGLYYFTFVDDSIAWRIRMYTVMTSIVSLCAVYIIAKGLKIERRLRPVMAISTNFGAYGLMALFSFNAIAELALGLVRPGLPLSSEDTGTTLLLIASTITILGIAVSLLIMTMEELSVEHKENAIFDPITTILNHRTFLEVSQHVLGVALSYSKPVTLITIEIANLDQVAKQFGIRIGNELLRHFSLMATDRRRNEDVIARSSFNQFLVLLPGVDENGAQVVIKKIRQSVLGEDYV